MNADEFEEHMRRIEEEEDGDTKDDLTNRLMDQLSDENTEITSASSLKEDTADYMIQMAESSARAREAISVSEAFVLFARTENAEFPDLVTWKTYLAGASKEDYFSLVLCCKTMLEMLADTLDMTKEDDDAIT